MSKDEITFQDLLLLLLLLPEESADGIKGATTSGLRLGLGLDGTRNMS
jgi:hypothetical protein